MLSLRITFKQVGLLSAVLYYIFCYISCYEGIPSELNSVFLYLFIGLGVISLVLTKCRNLFTPYLKWYLGFIFFSLICIPITVIYAGTKGISDTLYQMLVSFALCNSLVAFVNDSEDLKKIGMAHIIGAVSLFGLLAYAGELHVDERLGTTVTGNANTFASMFMVAALYAVWILILSGKKTDKIFALAALIVIVYALMLSGGRKFIIIPFVFLYLILIFKTDKHGRKHIFIYTFSIAAIVYGLYFLMMNVDTLYESIGYRMQFLINQITGKGEIGRSNTIRKELRKLAFKEGWTSPIVGHGFDSFKFLGWQKLNFFAYSHNNWTEMWYNGGIIGLVVYYSFYYKVVCQAWKIKEVNQPAALLGLAGIMSIFIYEYGGVDYCTYPIQSFICLLSILIFSDREGATYESL